MNRLKMSKKILHYFIEKMSVDRGIQQFSNDSDDIIYQSRLERVSRSSFTSIETTAKSVFISKNEQGAEKFSVNVEKKIKFRTLLEISAKVLGLSHIPTKIYREDGSEIRSINQLIESEVLYCSNGEPFFHPITDVYRIAILGCYNVGKTAITIQFIRNHFITEYDSTIEDSYSTSIKVDNLIALLQLFDTGGQEQFSSFHLNWMSNKEGYIFVYNTTNLESVKNLSKYINLLETIWKDKSQLIPPIIFVANQLDLLLNNSIEVEVRNEVNQQIATIIDECHQIINNINNDYENQYISNTNMNLNYNNLPTYHRIRLIETSARDNIGIQDLFQSIVREIRLQKRMIEMIQKANNSNNNNNNNSEIKNDANNQKSHCIIA